MKPSIGSDISILVGFATAQGAVGVTSILASIVEETEKAYKISSFTKNEKEIFAWIPKSSLTSMNYIPEMEYFSCKFAKWFKPSGWTLNFIENTSRDSVISS
jgi:hypothetical protein